jgi:predicted neuraminidase
MFWRGFGFVHHSRTLSVAPCQTLGITIRNFFIAVTQAVSVDGGTKWSAPELTPLPNPNAKIHMMVLSNGLLALCYNDHTAKGTCMPHQELPKRAVTWDPGGDCDIALGSSRALPAGPLPVEQGRRFDF